MGITTKDMEALVSLLLLWADRRRTVLRIATVLQVELLLGGQDILPELVCIAPCKCLGHVIDRQVVRTSTTDSEYLVAELNHQCQKCPQVSKTRTAARTTRPISSTAVQEEQDRHRC